MWIQWAVSTVDSCLIFKQTVSYVPGRGGNVVRSGPEPSAPVYKPPKRSSLVLAHFSGRRKTLLSEIMRNSRKQHNVFIFESPHFKVALFSLMSTELQERSSCLDADQKVTKQSSQSSVVRGAFIILTAGGCRVLVQN